MLEEYIEDNYFARFDTHSSHCFRKILLNARLDVNVDGRTEIQTPMLHPATSRCDKKHLHGKRYRADTKLTNAVKTE